VAQGLFFLLATIESVTAVTPEFSQASRPERAVIGFSPLVNGQHRQAVYRSTMVGLVFESAVGLRKMIEPSLHFSCGPAAPWFEVLIRLSRSPGQRLRMSDLAAQTSLTPSGLTRAVDRLHDLGLVTREACSADRRGTYAALTDAGQQAMDATLPRHEALVFEILEGVFDADEEALFLALMRKLRDRVNPDAARMTDDDDGYAADPDGSLVEVVFPGP
jgi:DNA-binding MarR family transcriptional regulator